MPLRTSGSKELQISITIPTKDEIVGMKWYEVLAMITGELFVWR